jgi:hypothetical protein
MKPALAALYHYHYKTAFSGNTNAILLLKKGKGIPVTGCEGP